ncbi:type II toxin-antitoxin system PemK/MazF family toxin [Leuconostoc mesenteroides]|uniref:type II toxin-antitoxin system PemK/MazF family toxin n=1 Tax=Leuconostoc mesenteroides TaxID=1245 RepID=UPI0022486E94|nr:type II toxin-antitoxin system PemK/MazF family toxin [Leuconostoc mesenteroides]MCX2666625.1 type II toxin-antitoxin system PemK/MazF family toxin [Leuconostoc mesenteroides subsp. mesenteroides]
MADSTKISYMRRWGNRKITLQREYESDCGSTDNKNILQGGIYSVNFGTNLGKEVDKVRPAIVVSNQQFNNKKNGLIVVAPLTGTLVLKKNGFPKYDYHFVLKQSDYNFLEKDSTIEFNHIRSISSKRIDSGNPYGFVDSLTLNAILDKLKKFFR